MQGDFVVYAEEIVVLVTIISMMMGPEDHCVVEQKRKVEMRHKLHPVRGRHRWQELGCIFVLREIVIRLFLDSGAYHDRNELLLFIILSFR